MGEIWLLVGREMDGNHVKNYMMLEQSGKNTIVQKRSIIKFCREHTVLNVQIAGDNIVGKNISISALPKYSNQYGFGLQQVGGMTQAEVIQYAQPLINQYKQKEESKRQRELQNSPEEQKRRQEEYVVNKLNCISRLLDIALAMKDITNEMASNGQFTRYLKQIDIDNAEGDSLSSLIQRQGVNGLASGLEDRLSRLSNRTTKYKLNSDIKDNINSEIVKCSQLRKMHKDTRKILIDNRNNEKERELLLKQQQAELKNIDTYDEVPIAEVDEEDAIALDNLEENTVSDFDNLQINEDNISVVEDINEEEVVVINNDESIPVVEDVDEEDAITLSEIPTESHKTTIDDIIEAVSIYLNQIGCNIRQEKSNDTCIQFRVFGGDLKKLKQIVKISWDKTYYNIKIVTSPELDNPTEEMKEKVKDHNIFMNKHLISEDNPEEIGEKVKQHLIKHINSLKELDNRLNIQDNEFIELANKIEEFKKTIDSYIKDIEWADIGILSYAISIDDFIDNYLGKKKLVAGIKKYKNASGGSTLFYGGQEMYNALFSYDIDKHCNKLIDKYNKYISDKEKAEAEKIKQQESERRYIKKFKDNSEDELEDNLIQAYSNIEDILDLVCKEDEDKEDYFENPFAYIARYTAISIERFIKNSLLSDSNRINDAIYDRYNFGISINNYVLCVDGHIGYASDVQEAIESIIKELVNAFDSNSIQYINHSKVNDLINKLWDLYNNIENKFDEHYDFVNDQWGYFTKSLVELEEETKNCIKQLIDFLEDMLGYKQDTEQDENDMVDLGYETGTKTTATEEEILEALKMYDNI